MGSIAGYRYSLHLLYYFVYFLSRVLLHWWYSAVLQKPWRVLCVSPSLWITGWNWFGKTPHNIIFYTKSQ